MSESNKTPSRRTKSIPRDVSEALGKMPPQALDLEESVLGALMLEKKVVKEVTEYLMPEHFYSEVHREIFGAIKSLWRQDDPVDMRTVVNQLRITGKIDLIGGAVYIAELASKVASAANVHYHARIIIEHYVKRELILLGSDLHRGGYDDESDAIENLEASLNKIRELHDRVLKPSGPQKIKPLWESTLILEEPVEPPPLISIDGCPVCTPGNHSLVVGKKKSRKTLFIIWLVSQYLRDPRTTGKEVLIFDTEQGRKHVFRIRKKIHQLTGKYVAVFYLRGMSPGERQEFVRDTVAYWDTPPQLIVHDGIRDMMTDINDPKETTAVITWLERLTLALRPAQLYPPHVINVLHLNKTDSNARGHIGSELLNKAEITIELENNEKAACTDVRCESSREKPFHPFSFTHNSDDLPELTMAPHDGTVLPAQDRNSRIITCFEGEMLKYAELQEAVKIEFGVGITKAKSMIQEFVRLGLVVRSGSYRSPSTMYKCMLSTNGTLVSGPAPPAELFVDDDHHDDNGADVVVSGDDLPF